MQNYRYFDVIITAPRVYVDGRLSSKNSLTFMEGDKLSRFKRIEIDIPSITRTYHTDKESVFSLTKKS